MRNWSWDSTTALQGLDQAWHWQIMISHGTRLKDRRVSCSGRSGWKVRTKTIWRLDWPRDSTEVMRKGRLHWQQWPMVIRCFLLTIMDAGRLKPARVRHHWTWRWTVKSCAAHSLPDNCHVWICLDRTWMNTYLDRMNEHDKLEVYLYTRFLPRCISREWNRLRFMNCIYSGTVLRLRSTGSEQRSEDMNM
jgi:hypothetical protein